ncbi:hypothetical protein [Chitinophaga parva]|uniref:hypothetical protein n=1 Tax=Chitinophaga parva TaxID=2169414 RepID=UPI001057033B|nr:hypothetical protein [Chitinophaga parva]
MKKRILLLLLLASIFGNVFLLFIPVNASSGASEQGVLTQQNRKSYNDSVVIRSLRINAIEQFKNEGVIIRHELSTSSGKALDIGKIVSQKGQLLVFQFDRNACSACIENEMSNLNDLGNVNPYAILIVATSFDNDIQAKLYLDRFKIPFRFIAVNKENFPFTTVPHLIPCYFMLDQTLRTSRFFIPDKNNNDLTNRYLKLTTEPRQE